FNHDIFYSLLLCWIVVNNISFLKIEQHSFQVLLNYLLACVSFSFLIFTRFKWLGCSSTNDNASYTEMSRTLPNSSNTIKNWILERY
ncbi:hypothetical protein L873DRAFT_1656079, partial [Choiromyces venosus 120613-1]